MGQHSGMVYCSGRQQLLLSNVSGAFCFTLVSFPVFVQMLINLRQDMCVQWPVEGRAEFNMLVQVKQWLLPVCQHYGSYWDIKEHPGCITSDLLSLHVEQGSHNEQHLHHSDLPLFFLIYSSRSSKSPLHLLQKTVK